METIDAFYSEHEEWRDITGFDGFYQISNYGRVKSLPHPIHNGNGYFISKERILKPNTLAKGYLQVTLSDASKKRHALQVHRIVATMFIQNPCPDNYNQVNHKNGNKQDNRAENLEWVDNSLNQKHAYATGLCVHSDKAGKPKRSIMQIDPQTNRVVKIWDSVAVAVRTLNLKNSSNLFRVLSKKRHYITLKGYKWVYYNE